MNTFNDGRIGFIMLTSLSTWEGVKEHLLKDSRSRMTQFEKKKTETVVSLPHDSENKQRCNLGLLTTRQYGRGTYNSFTESYKCVVIKGRNTTMVSFKRDRNVFSETRIFLRACNSLDYY
jgi:hypothetical protein